MITYLLIAVGGALGSMGRYFLNGVVTAITGPTFPWGTMLINIVGSFAIGFYATMTDPADGRIRASGAARQFVMTGICGGFTTFSSFSLQTLTLARDGEWVRAGGNVIGSVTLCLVAVWVGHLAASWLTLRKGI
jgi:CrcB protein